MHWGSAWGARFDAKGHGVADCSHPVKGFASGFATLDCLLPICCTAAKATMDRPCLPAIHFLLLPGVDAANFWVTFCVIFYLTNTHPTIHYNIIRGKPYHVNTIQLYFYNISYAVALSTMVALSRKHSCKSLPSKP